MIEIALEVSSYMVLVSLLRIESWLTLQRAQGFVGRIYCLRSVLGEIEGVIESGDCRIVNKTLEVDVRAFGS